MLWMAAPTQYFYLFFFNIPAINGITLSMTFGAGRNLYRRCKYVVYGRYGPPIGNHIVTCGPKPPYKFF